MARDISWVIMLAKAIMFCRCTHSYSSHNAIHFPHYASPLPQSLEDDFVEMRKANPDMNAEIFHHLLNVARSGYHSNCIGQPPAKLANWWSPSGAGLWVWVLAVGSSLWTTGTTPSSWRHSAQPDWPHEHNVHTLVPTLVMSTYMAIFPLCCYELTLSLKFDSHVIIIYRIQCKSVPTIV